jgi:AraC-like DNA-binding protein
MTTKVQSWDNTLIAVYYPMAWIEYAREKGLPIQQMMHRCGMGDGKLTASTSILVRKFSQLLAEILLLTGNQGTGFEVGWRLPITAYGSIGQAMLSSNTARDALNICSQYWRLIARGFDLRISLHNHQCVLTLTLAVPVPQPFRQVLFESTLASLYRGCVALVPAAMESIEVWLSGPEPAYSTLLREKIPSICFDRPATQIRFPAALLEQDLSLASATGLQTALERCEEELTALNLQDKMAQKVMEKLLCTEHGYPTLNEMAEQLNMSPRTLRRRLSAENTGYARLMEQSKQRNALKLLDNPRFSIADVAHRLGYGDMANFTRAFKKWTGTTPSGYRAYLKA